MYWSAAHKQLQENVLNFFKTRITDRLTNIFQTDCLLDRS